MKNGWVRKVGQVGRQVRFGLEGSKSTTIRDKAMYRATWAAKKREGGEREKKNSNMGEKM